MMEINLIDFLKQAVNEYFKGTSASIIMGMTYGIKAGIDPKLYNLIKASGLSHLIVFSGSNIVIIYSIIYRSLFAIRSKVRIIIASLLMLIFISLLPQEASIMRATTMWIFTIAGTLMDKKTSKVYTLLLSVIILAFINPEILTNVSFQLSIAAILGIIIFNQKVFEHRSDSLFANVLTDTKTTISAQVFTAPLIYYYFHSFNPLATIPNIIISPLVSPIILLGLCAPMMLLLSVPNYTIFSIVAVAITQVFTIVVNIFSKYQL